MLCGFPAQYSIDPCSRESREGSGRPRAVNCWLWEVASAVHDRNLDRYGEALKKRPVKRERSGQLLACNCTSPALHSDSTKHEAARSPGKSARAFDEKGLVGKHKSRFALTQVCKGRDRASRSPF